VLHEVNASDPEGGLVNYSIIAGNQDLIWMEIIPSAYPKVEN
jgi:hypothetical protein